MENKNESKEARKHGTDLLPYDVYRTQIPKFYTSFPMHWHEEIEIVYVLKGYAKYIIDFEEIEIWYEFLSHAECKTLYTTDKSQVLTILKYYIDEICNTKTK